jgi:hypothetical protein
MRSIRGVSLCGVSECLAAHTGLRPTCALGTLAIPNCRILWTKTIRYGLNKSKIPTIDDCRP